MSIVYIGLGANLNNRLSYLKKAVIKLNKHPRVELHSLSSIYETDPVGTTAQERYLNAVCAVETNLSPLDLLQLTKQIEHELGRKEKGNWASRLIDLDILVYPETIIHNENLQLPHPLIAYRWFVLVPLAEIAPQLIPPGFSQNVKELLQALGPPEGVDKLDLQNPWDEFSYFLLNKQ